MTMDKLHTDSGHSVNLCYTDSGHSVNLCQ